jgi:hypothetical protein
MSSKILGTVAALLVAACIGAGAAASGPGGSTAVVESPRFSAKVDNPWFPLAPGTVVVYSGAKDGEQARDVVTVTRRTRTIAGAPCRVVQDRLFLDGRLAERTTDWYTQDAAGNVWYFGERTAELDRRGRDVSREGSWEAGVDGAIPGIFMPARPRVGAAYRQEFYRGHAEDHFRIVAVLHGVTAPRGPSILLTREWTPLEPGVVDRKLYVRGIGNVVERSLKGGAEHLELVSLRRSG